MVVLSSASGFAKLPKSPGPVMLFPNVQYSNQISLYFGIAGPQVRMVARACIHTHTHTHTHTERERRTQICRRHAEMNMVAIQGHSPERLTHCNECTTVL